ncbi:MAG TPA: branched-chain amino acid ABC transporter permease [Acidimicrobiales bacterium]|nr:branched-chain amino acid ABC transporter permease [Acidimicrobiales bacterium]
MDWQGILTVALTTAFGPTAIVFALAAIGLNVHFGYTGLVNFGQVAFLAVGAYTIAMGVVTYGLSFWLCVFLSLVTATVLALLLGAPTLRLREDYLAIVTIAAGEIIRLVLRAAEFRESTGGAAGIQNFAGDFYDLNPYSAGRRSFDIPGTDVGVTYSANDLWLLTVGWGTVALACLVVYLLMRSPWGRVLKAIREDEQAVRSLGKNVYVYKMQSLIIGGIIGAIGGVLFALARQSVVPDSLGTLLTFFAYVALVLGGAARVLGPVLGAIVFFFLQQFLSSTLRQAVANDHIDFLVANEVGIVVQILVGVGLMALMIFRPQGIIGDKSEVAVSVRR